MGSSRKYPDPPRKATEIPRGGGRGGGAPFVQKEAISEGMGGCVNRFFSGGLSKMDELLIKNSFSVEHAISFLLLPLFQIKLLLYYTFDSP